MLRGAFTRDGGFELGSRIAEQDIGGACVFATNDDLATLRDFVRSLTTVRLPLEEMGVQAAVLRESTRPR